MKKIYRVNGGRLIEKIPWNTKRVMIIFFPALILLTIASIYIVYEKNSFSKWSLSFLYAVGFAPFEILLTYPGLNRLGVSSDGKALTLIFTLAIIHGIGFYVVFRGIKNIPE